MRLVSIVRLTAVAASNGGTISFASTDCCILPLHSASYANTVQCDQQVAWVHSCKVDAKRPGVLAPFAKLPTLVDRMQVGLHYSIIPLHEW
jgi:hypothetical protein